MNGKLNFLITQVLPYQDCVVEYAVKRLYLDDWKEIGPGFTDPHKFCTRNKLGQGVNVADSGSALTIGGMLVGIASWTGLITGGTPDVYTNVFGHIVWIRRELSISHTF